MTIAVMQPYIFPYLGYYQLVSAVDKFIFFDDVNFINKGWINRNRILVNNDDFRFTIPLIKASQNKVINEIEIADFIKWRSDFLKTLESNYKKAPFFLLAYQRIYEFLHYRDYVTISELAEDSVKAVASLLDISTEFITSSSLDYKSAELQSGQDKILRICKIMHADHYINPINGMDIYNEERFFSEGIVLDFIQMRKIIYEQFGKSDFVSSLSIIDVLMFLSLEEVKLLLGQFDLVKKMITNVIK